MLRTRVVTALVLLAVLLAVLFSGSFALLALGLIVFFAAAAWESFRLFKSSHPALGAALWTLVFAWLLFSGKLGQARLLYALCTAIWVIRFAPSLALGLPPIDSIANRLLAGIYALALLGCFAGIVVLVQHSALYLLSVLVLVWAADVGAYFAGKAFGKRKLAPSISPGKSWEGVVGGWIAALILGAVLCALAAGSFPARVQLRWGWAGLAAVMTLLVAASVVGDLFESQLKRRAGFKDSGTLLPGHGGVLDRIDALIPVVPLAVLFDSWL